MQANLRQNLRVVFLCLPRSKGLTSLNNLLNLIAVQLFLYVSQLLLFDRNLVVIGAGSAGLVTSYIAAAVKARVEDIWRGLGL